MIEIKKMREDKKMTDREKMNKEDKKMKQGTRKTKKDVNKNFQMLNSMFVSVCFMMLLLIPCI